MEVWRRWKQDNRAETAAGSEAKPAQKGAANAGKAAAAGKAGAGARVVKAEDTQAQPLTAGGSRLRLRFFAGCFCRSKLDSTAACLGSCLM